MAQTLYTRLGTKSEFSERERLILLEIGRDRIDTASSFVDYISESYDFSKSSVWYNLKGLKAAGIIDFADRLRIGEPLKLTKEGLHALCYMERHMRQQPKSDTSVRERVGFGPTSSAYGVSGRVSYVMR